MSGAVVALGPATYTAYMLVQYIVGPSYLDYPKVLLLHLGLFVLGSLVAVRAWTDIEETDLPAMNERTRRVRSWILFGLAAFVVLRYLPALLGSVRQEPLTDEFRAEPAFFWTILLMDLGIVVPFTIATAVTLRGDAPSGAKATYAVVGWFALVPPSVAAMAITMLVNRDSNRSVGAVVLFVVAAAAFAAFAFRLDRPLLTPKRERAR